jgi:hypothetical protein
MAHAEPFATFSLSLHRPLRHKQHEFSLVYVARHQITFLRFALSPFHRQVPSDQIVDRVLILLNTEVITNVDAFCYSRVSGMNIFISILKVNLISQLQSSTFEISLLCVSLFSFNKKRD